MTKVLLLQTKHLQRFTCLKIVAFQGTDASSLIT